MFTTDAVCCNGEHIEINDLITYSDFSSIYTGVQFLYSGKAVWKQDLYSLMSADDTGGQAVIHVHGSLFLTLYVKQKENNSDNMELL